MKKTTEVTENTELRKVKPVLVVPSLASDKCLASSGWILIKSL